jgi:hypothetical protein
MNKNVVLALTVFSLVAGYYLVTSVSAGNVDVPVTVHDSVPHHQAPLNAPHGDHIGVPTGVPTDVPFPCAPSDAHRTDVPLDVPTDAPLNAPLLDAPNAGQLDVPIGVPLTGTFPCDTTGIAPATS